MTASVRDALARRATTSVRVREGANAYKLVACDMDGTLLSSRHTISDRTRRVLAQLLARGVHVIFATGRPYTDVHRIKRRLNIFATATNIATAGVQLTTPTTSTASPPSSSSLLLLSPMASPITQPSPATLCTPQSNDEQHHDDHPQAYHHSNDGNNNNATTTTTTLSSPRADAVNGERVVPRCFAITSNGACIYDELNRRVYERTIAPALCRELYALFASDPHININVFRGVDVAERQRAGYVNPSDEGDDKAHEEWVCRYPSDVEAQLYSESHFTFRVVPDLEATYATNNVNEIFFLCYDLDKSRRAEDAIVRHVAEAKARLGLTAGVRVAPSAPYCLDVIPDDVSKGSALSYVVEQLGLTLADVVAFGDGMNDVEMLQAVGKGCIMANANPRLKAALPHLEVIGSNDDDAVARKLQELFDLPDE